MISDNRIAVIGVDLVETKYLGSGPTTESEVQISCSKWTFMAPMSIKILLLVRLVKILPKKSGKSAL
ncbi:unnamed protein product [Enterobius vermicularis]|uniref:Transposase n=1 Tax=Enterobius vermicularis TaxID=51028 RepID=A0A0N4VKP9_ENTVE|nr:unnamed protein product [Enterobius vermicularis]